MMNKVLFASLAVFALVGVSVTSQEASAGGLLPTETMCTPFHPYPAVTHQKCTVYRYGANGELIATSVYYIDEKGMHYLLP